MGASRSRGRSGADGPTRTRARLDAAKLARGETRPSRLNGLEPLPRRRQPTMPKDMDEVAQQAWRLVMREMGATGVLTGADTHVLRVYCEAYSRSVALPAVLEVGAQMGGFGRGERI